MATFSIAGASALRARLATCCYGDEYTRINLQLFGSVGHGKSTLINWCTCIVQDTDFTNVTSASNWQSTKELRSYKLTDTLYITDNRGLTHSLDEDYVLEICAQFRQLRKEGPVDWKCNKKTTMDLLPERHDNRPAEITVPVFVFSEKPYFDMSRLGVLFAEAERITGIFPLVSVIWPLQMPESKMKEVKYWCDDFLFLRIPGDTQPGVNADTEMDVLRFLDACVTEGEKQMSKRRGADRQVEFMRQATAQIRDEHGHNPPLDISPMNFYIVRQLEKLRKYFTTFSRSIE